MRVRLIAYSDYLCPWCFNGAVRLQRLEEEFGDELEIEWRSFLLRPQLDPNRTLEKFRAYTQSWLRPAAEPDAATFRVWASAAGPPSHSVPPHLLAKAAATIHDDAFRQIHMRLLHAYFADNRDITDEATLRAIWGEAGLASDAFDRIRDPAILQRVLDEHHAAVDAGVTGVPAVRADDNDAFITGAFPLDTYRRWIVKLRAARRSASALS